MNNLPQDPMMLYSVLNTRLRDQYPSLEALCEDLQIDQKAIEEKLKAFDFVYNREKNRFE